MHPGNPHSLGSRGGESGLGGTCTGFGNGFAGGSPRGGSGVIASVRSACRASTFGPSLRRWFSQGWGF